MQEELDKLKSRRDRLLEYMKEQSIGNDFYYTCGSYKDDKYELDFLNKEIERIKNVQE
jgi:uncharacterized protein YydD (DUF2326 family)